MSGHNKWSKIKNKKGAADAKRGAVFTRLGKLITVAAREGGGDQEMNFKLRMAVTAAKAANMPNDNVERAIKRGTGEIEGGVMEEGVFEAYGPGGVAFIIETLSDNKNRVVSEVQHALKKNGATPAEQGSVMYNFDRKAVVSVMNPEIADKDEFELALIDAGAEDIDFADEGVTVEGDVVSFQKLAEAVEAAGLTPDEAGLQYLPKNPLSIDDVVQTNVDKIADALEELDDVQAVYTNVE